MNNQHEDFADGDPELRDGYEEYQAQLELEKWVGSDYLDGLCPDCSEDIPAEAVEGTACLNCGHVFIHYRPINHE
jgi:hypothetical protein